MGTASGIELGPASCVLVSARPGATGAEVAAVHVVEPAEWPAGDAALTAMLRETRKAKRFPRRARVVAWALTEPAAVSDPRARAVLRPFTAAGFRVEAVLTPVEALAAVAASRRRPNEGPIAWLSVNTHGAAMVILHGTRILFSRTLQWTFNPLAQTVKEQLLQRYSFVTHIGPELKRGIRLVRSEHGMSVETVVTCGDLPDLRSLTMPLIEELDLEVETLDSSEGLIPKGAAKQDRFVEWAPAIRLACAAAVTRVSRGFRGVPAAIAAGMLIALVGLGVYAALNRAPVLTLGSRVKGQDPVPMATNSPPSVRPAEAPPAQVPPAVVPQVEDPPLQNVATRGSLPVPGPQTVVREPQPPPRDPPPPAREPQPAARQPQPAAPKTSRPQLIEAPRPTAPRRPPEKKSGPPLPPVPPVTSILIDGARRLAIIGGSIVTEGDRVGARIVVRIERRAVVLREPSGEEITVLLRPDGLGGVKSTPLTGPGGS